jgi:ABC-type arginine/histidine transport system permease subunit
VGFLVQVIKGTALASVIGFIELTKAGTMITNATFQPFTVYSLRGADVLCAVLPVSLAKRRRWKGSRSMARMTIPDAPIVRSRGCASRTAATRCSRAST